MARSRRRTLHLTALVSVLALLALAGTLSDAAFKSGTGVPDDLFHRQFLPRHALVAPPIAWDIIRVTMWGGLLLALAYLVLSAEARRDMIRLMLKYLALLLVAVTFFLTTSHFLAYEAREELLEEGIRPTEPEQLEIAELAEQLETVAYEADPPPALTLLLTMAMTAGLVLLGYTWWQRRQADRAILQQAPELSQRALQAIEELRLGSQLEEVILRCYREMAQIVAAERGLARARGMTPREFEAQLQRNGLPAEPVRRLTRLFEAVRYGHATAGERERLEAISDLQAIVAACFDSVKRCEGDGVTGSHFMDC